MNPLTNMKNVIKLSERELQNNSKSSWHDQYRDSAWIFIGGLPFDLTEGDIICIFSQYGEIVNINLIRDKDNGKSKGFCFLCYEDQRSTILAVDNLNGIKVLNRSIRVDHVSKYKVPKEGKKTDEETKQLYNEGCAPKPVIPVIKNPMVIDNPEYRRETLADQIQAEIKLPARLPIRMDIKKEIDMEQVEVKSEQSERKKKKKSRNHSDSEDDVSKADHIKRKKRKKNLKKHDSSSDSSDNEKELKNKRKHSSPSPDRKMKPRYRSKSRENNIRDSRNTDGSCSRNSNSKSKFRNISRSSERERNRSRNSSGDNKRYEEKQSNFERRGRESRRRSRS